MKKRRSSRKPARISEAPAVYVSRSGARLLLDTQVWIWWKAGEPRLGPVARAAIVQAREVRLSVASAWEIVIKVALGKLRIPAFDDFGAELAKHGFLDLPILLRHVEGVKRLPRLHGDPFDRIICAQAAVEGLTLVTSDAALAGYGISTMLASR